MISVVYDNDIYLDPLLTSVTWSGDITQAFRTLQASFKNTLDNVSQALDIELGRELRLYDDDTELFRGIIFAHDINARGDMTLTAYDENVYLTKNADTRKFSGMTASEIITQLCADFGIPTGSVAETGYVIPRLILRDKTLWEMMVTALSETKRQNGRRFWITASGGQLNVIERGEKVVDWVLENGVNITDASYGLNIEDLRNVVKVTANDEGDSKKAPISVTAQDSDLITQFGMMQHIDHMDSNATQSSADQMARETLSELSKIKDTATVEALGNVDVTAGAAVYVIESLTQIVGGFYVITDSHTWQNGVHKMSLSISGDESLPTMKYEDIYASTTDNSAGDGGKTKKKKKAKKAHTTAGMSQADIDAALANLNS